MLLNYTLLEFESGIAENRSDLVHAVIAATFNGNKSEAHPLWRSEAERPGGARVLLQWMEDTPPNWDNALAMKNNHLIGIPCQFKQIEFAPPKGSRFFFRLRGNNTARVERRSKTAVIPCTEWLEKRAGMSGFEVIRLHIANSEYSQYITKKNHRFRLSSVLFEGLLQVIDPEKFEKAVAFGVGRGKAYGMGLLSLRR